MSMKKVSVRLTGKNNSTDSMESEKLSAKIRGTNARETRFDSHTQASLMKRREPRRSSSMRSSRASKRSEVDVLPSRLYGVCKRRNSATKQSKSMQTLRTILKRDHGASDCLQSELTQARRRARLRAENSHVLAPQDSPLPHGSRDLSRRAQNLPIERSLAVQDESTNTIGRPQKRVGNSQVSLEDDAARYVSRADSWQQCSTMTSATHSSSRSDSPRDDCPEIYLNTAHRIRSQLRSDDEESTDSQSEVPLRSTLKQATEPENGAKSITSSEDHSFKIHIGVSANVTSRKCARKKTLIKDGRTAIPNGGANGACNAKFVKYVNDVRDRDNNRAVNNGDMISSQRRRKEGFGNQRIWKPAGINRTSTVENTMTLTQKFRPAGKSLALTKDRQRNEHMSMKSVESFNNNSTSTSISLPKPIEPLMKENRDPRIDRITKINEPLAETKNQRKLQNRGILPKRRCSTTKVMRFPSSSLSKTNDLKISSKHNANPEMPSSRYRQTRLMTSKKYSTSRINGVDRCRIESTLIYKRRSRPSEIINTLKEIINNTREDDSVEERTVNVPKMSEANARQILSNCDTSSKVSPDSELHFARIENSNKAAVSYESSRKSISIQTDLSLLLENDFKRDFYLKEISKSTQTIATQTSPCCDKNIVKIVCNTMPHDTFCEDAGISYDLRDLTSFKTDATTIEDKLLDDFNLIKETKSITHEEEIRRDEISKNCDNWIKTAADKHQESIKRFSNYDAINDIINNSPVKRSCRSLLSIYEYDASCSESSEEITENIESNVECKDMVMTELKLKNIPSDVIAAFQLAVERARNLYKAIAIYRGSLRSRESEIQEKEAADDDETSIIYKSQYCIKKSTSLVSCQSGSRTSECDSNCHFIMMNENFDGFSSSSSSSIQICKQGTQIDRALMLPAIEEALIISREHFVPLIYCILCTVVFWCLQFSFTCDPAA